MIDVDYNEYKKTIAENMKLIVENDRLKKLYETDKESWKEQMYELQERIDKAIEYITSEETINMFSSINAREKWLKINHKLLKILKGEDK
jgi:hypothetical protein